MNILIVGNGFDLSHYLPTKYDHFMDVMEAIESKETGGLPLNFEDKNLEEWLKSLNSIFENSARLKGFNIVPDKAAINFLEKIKDVAQQNKYEIKK